MAKLPAGAWIVLTALGGLAQAPAQDTEGVTVRCVDADGFAVAGAVVHVFQRIALPDGSGQYGRFGPLETDAEGRARCPVGLTYDGGRFDRFVHARVPGHSVGGGRAFRFEPEAEEAEPAVLEVRMVRSRTFTGTVAVPPGFAAEDVRVSVLSAYVAGEGLGTPLARLHGMTGLDDALPELFETPVGADGSFELRDLPGDGRLFLAASGPGLAPAQWANLRPGDADRIEFALEPESVLAGVVVDPDGRGVERATVDVRLAGDDKTFVLTTFRTRTDASGHFRIGGLPATEVHLRVEPTAPDLVFLPQAVVTQEPKGGEALELRLERGVRVSGIVVAKGDRAPIEGARVAAFASDSRLTLASARTDADGRFRLMLPPVEVSLYFSSVPSGFDYRAPRIVKTLDAGSDTLSLRLLRLELARTK